MSAEEIFIKYEEKREAAARKRSENIERVYKLVPRIREIDKEINIFGIQNVQNILRDPHNHEKYNSEMEENLTRLEEEKRTLFLSGNYSQYDVYW